jgi:4'-phosphopantetheinyl transferase
MAWTVGDLRGLEAIAVPDDAIVYAYVSLDGRPSSDEFALLDDAEADRARRFVRARDEHRFVLAHAALRVLLAHAVEVVPERVAYEHGQNGKPFLARGLGSLQFNMSHSGEIGLVAMCRDRPLGVDVEELRELANALDIAKQNFSAAEQAALQSLPQDEQEAAFFRCWTRKEALLKAIGDGIGTGLDTFDVDLAPGSTSALERYAGRPGDEAPLSLRELPAPAGYIAAGAVEAGSTHELRWNELTAETGFLSPPERAANEETAV